MQKTQLYKRCLSLLAALMMAIPSFSLAEMFKVVKGGSLNLRSEASLSSSVLGQYPSGTWMNVLEDSGEWSKVSVNGKEGYVMSKYLADSAASSTYYVRTNTGVGLNLRSEPSLSGDIITSYKPATAVNVLSKGNGWFKVSVGDNVGYMASRYLATNASSGNVSVGFPKTGVVANPGVNQVLLLRESASADARVLGYYGNGVSVKLLGESGSFYKVTVDGKSGYMMKKYIKLTSSAPSVNTPAAQFPEAPFTAKLTNPNGNWVVNFRKTASLSGSIIKAYPVGTEITVTEVGAYWCKATIDGVEGYVSSYFLTVVK